MAEQKLQVFELFLNQINWGEDSNLGPPLTAGGNVEIRTILCSVPKARQRRQYPE